MNPELKMSQFPEEAANWHWDNAVWSESKKICDNCKDVYMWSTGWYDDPPHMGGACIGEKYHCGNCGKTEYN